MLPCRFFMLPMPSTCLSWRLFRVPTTKLILNCYLFRVPIQRGVAKFEMGAQFAQVCKCVFTGEIKHNASSCKITIYDDLESAKVNFIPKSCLLINMLPSMRISIIELTCTTWQTHARQSIICVFTGFWLAIFNLPDHCTNCKYSNA